MTVNCAHTVEENVSVCLCVCTCVCLCVCSMQDSATLIADIIQSGPSPTASGEEIWQMFREKMASYSKRSES